MNDLIDFIRDGLTFLAVLVPSAVVAWLLYNGWMMIYNAIV